MDPLMRDDDKKVEHEHGEGKGLTVSARITLEDAERLKKAFANGELKWLGITDIQFGEPVPPLSSGTWRKSELRKKDKGSEEGLTTS